MITTRTSIVRERMGACFFESPIHATRHLFCDPACIRTHTPSISARSSIDRSPSQSMCRPVICAILAIVSGFFVVSISSNLSNRRIVPLDHNDTYGCVYGDAWRPYENSQGACLPSACVMGDSEDAQSPDASVCDVFPQVLGLLVFAIICVISSLLAIALTLEDCSPSCKSSTTVGPDV